MTTSSDFQTLISLKEQLPYDLGHIIDRHVHELPMHNVLNEVVPLSYWGLKHTKAKCEKHFERKAFDYSQSSGYVHHFENPIDNYPMNIKNMWTEELRSHCRQITQKKRLSKALTRKEVINMILKA